MGVLSFSCLPPSNREAVEVFSSLSDEFISRLALPHLRLLHTAAAACPKLMAHLYLHLKCFGLSQA